MASNGLKYQYFWSVADDIFLRVPFHFKYCNILSRIDLDSLSRFLCNFFHLFSNNNNGYRKNDNNNKNKANNKNNNINNAMSRQSRNYLCKTNTSNQQYL